MKDKTYCFFIGTTAEFIKITPVIKELKKRRLPVKFIIAGQTKVRFEDLEGYVGKLKGDFLLKQKINKSSTMHFILWMFWTLLSAPFILYPELKKLNKANSYFIIHGDTVTSTIGAIIAKLYRLNLVHIESGYFSYNFLEPFPEEICRNINVRLADILFSPNNWTKNNLKFIRGKKISTKQNTIIEPCLWALKNGKTPKFANYFKKYYILILHRQEHVIFRKDWSKKILELVIKNADPKLHCLILNHVLTAKIIESIKPNLSKELRSKLHLIPHTPYLDFMKLLENSEFVATDGCSNQQELYYMGKPCLALRDRTEQTEGVGENFILCKSDEKIIKNFLKNHKDYKKPPIKLKDSDRPSKIIVNYLEKLE